MSRYSASLPCKSEIVNANATNVLSIQDTQDLTRAAGIAGRAATLLQPQYIQFNGHIYVKPFPEQRQVFKSCADVLLYKKGLAIAANYHSNPPSLNTPAIASISALCAQRAKPNTGPLQLTIDLGDIGEAHPHTIAISNGWIDLGGTQGIKYYGNGTYIGSQSFPDAGPLKATFGSFFAFSQFSQSIVSIYSNTPFSVIIMGNTNSVAFAGGDAYIQSLWVGTPVGVNIPTLPNLSDDYPPVGGTVGAVSLANCSSLTNLILAGPTTLDLTGITGLRTLVYAGGGQLGTATITGLMANTRLTYLHAENISSANVDLSALLYLNYFIYKGSSMSYLVGLTSSLIFMDLSGCNLNSYSANIILNNLVVNGTHDGTLQFGRQQNFPLQLNPSLVTAVEGLGWTIIL
jgi:hypothetical protein